MDHMLYEIYNIRLLVQFSQCSYVKFMFVASMEYKYSRQTELHSKKDRERFLIWPRQRIMNLA